MSVTQSAPEFFITYIDFDTYNMEDIQCFGYVGGSPISMNHNAGAQLIKAPLIPGEDGTITCNCLSVTSRFRDAEVAVSINNGMSLSAVKITYEEGCTVTTKIGSSVVLGKNWILASCTDTNSSFTIDLNGASFSFNFNIDLQNPDEM